jgi:hypothetical protein
MRHVVPLLIVLSLGFAPAPVYRPGKPEPVSPAKQVEGLWMGRHDTLRIGPGRMRVGSVDYALKTDTAKRPWLFEITREDNEREKYLGIYKVEGGELVIGYNSAAMGWPTTFEGAGRGSFREVYRRKKS